MDKEAKAVLETLKAINYNQEMSRLHHRYVNFREALDALTEAQGLSDETRIYLAFCYAEQQAK